MSHHNDFYTSAGDQQMEAFWASYTPEEPRPFTFLRTSHHHASVSLNEPQRIEDEAAALVRDREWDRLHD